MNKFLLSIASLKALKSEIRKKFPVGSGLLSESLAFALGFNTHAALLAKIKHCKYSPCLVPIDDSRFLSRLSDFGVNLVGWTGFSNFITEEKSKMLDYKLKGGCYGIYFISDYISLRSLHSAIHTLAAKCFCDSIMNEDGGIYAFAYNVRKAYEGQRKKYPAGEAEPEMPMRYGFDLPWPLIFYWVKILQESVLRQSPDKLVKSEIYQLEAVIELAVREEFKDRANEIIKKWHAIDVTKSFCHEEIFSRVNYFEAVKPAIRKKYILDVLSALDKEWCVSYPSKPNDFRNAHLDPSTFAAPEYSN